MSAHQFHLSRPRAVLLHHACLVALGVARAERGQMKAGTQEHAAAGKIIRELEEIAAFLPTE